MGSNDKLEKPTPKLSKIFKHKKWIIIGVMAIVIIGFSVIGVLIYFSNQKSSDDKLLVQEAERTKVIHQTENNALIAVDKDKNVDKAVALYDKEIKLTNDSSLKKSLLIDKSTLYMNVNEYDAALAIAKQAEAVTKDANIEQYIAQIYEEMGDNQNAIKYYQNAIKLVDSTSPMANGDIEYYQSKVDTLGGTSK